MVCTVCSVHGLRFGVTQLPLALCLKSFIVEQSSSIKCYAHTHAVLCMVLHIVSCVAQHVSCDYLIFAVCWICSDLLNPVRHKIHIELTCRTYSHTCRAVIL